MNNIIEIWDSFYPQLFALLVNTAWQVALLATLIFLSIFLLKFKSAAMRYGLWLMVAFSPLFLTFWNLSIPAVNIHLFWHQSEQSVYEEKGLLEKYPMAILETVYHSPGKTTEFSDEKPDAIVSYAATNRASSISEEQPGVTTSESHFVLPISFKEILLLLWMLGVLGMTARLAKGLHGLRSLRKTAVKVEDEPIINLLDELRNSFSIQRKVQLAISDQLMYPVSFGWRKPIILIPSNFVDTISFDEVRMTFIHELAHFKRRDYLINIAISFLKSHLFFHPLFIFAQKQLQIQQEHICDDWVLQFSQKRTAYAQCLLRQAEVAILKTSPSIGTSVVSGFKNMRRRIDMILDPKRNLSINLSKKAAVFVLLICCVFTSLAATNRLLPSALAQQTEEEKLIAQIKETLQWYPMDEKLSPEQRTAAYQKNSEKGLALCKQFLEKHPQHEDAVKVKLDQLSFLIRLGRYDETEQLAREFLAEHPTDPYADGFRWTLVLIYKSKGEYDAALAELDLIKEPEWAVQWERNQIYQLKHRKEEIQRLLPLIEKSKQDAERRKEEAQQLLSLIEKNKLDAERKREEIQQILEDYKLATERRKEEIQQLLPPIEKSKLDAERRMKETQQLIEKLLILQIASPEEGSDYGVMVLNREIVEMADLYDRFINALDKAKDTLIIQAARDVPHEQIVQIMDIAKKANIDKISFAFER